MNQTGIVTLFGGSGLRILIRVICPSSSPKKVLINFALHMALLHDSTAARVGALFQLLVQDTTAQDFGLPSSAIRLRM